MWTCDKIEEMLNDRVKNWPNIGFHLTQLKPERDLMLQILGQPKAEKMRLMTQVLEAAFHEVFANRVVFGEKAMVVPRSSKQQKH